MSVPRITPIYNDHITSFFFDHYSHFALGIGDSYPVADEGAGPRRLPPVKGHPQLAGHIAAGLVADEFDLSFFQGKGLDHGCFSPLSVLWPHEPGWPGAIIPFQVGVLLTPGPTAQRCYKLGKSLRKAILTYPENLKVAIVATGGLSHQVHGERAGFNNTSKIRKLHQSYYLPSMTAIGTAIYEDDVAEPADETSAAYLERIHRQTKGVEEIEGTYPFTVDTSVRAYRLNRFLHDLIIPEHRRKFLADPETTFEEAGLTEKERAMVRNLDWREMIHYGVIFFMLEKLGAVVGTSNLHIYAAMRGQSLEDFQKTRNAQVLYSVAGQDAGKTDWDKKEL